VIGSQSGGAEKVALLALDCKVHVFDDSGQISEFSGWMAGQTLATGNFDLLSDDDEIACLTENPAGNQYRDILVTDIHGTPISGWPLALSPGKEGTSSLVSGNIIKKDPLTDTDELALVIGPFLIILDAQGSQVGGHFVGFENNDLAQRPIIRETDDRDAEIAYLNGAGEFSLFKGINTLKQVDVRKDYVKGALGRRANPLTWVDPARDGDINWVASFFLYLLYPEPNLGVVKVMD